MLESLPEQQVDQPLNRSIPMIIELGSVFEMTQELYPGSGFDQEHPFEP
jgi:hypothetical protein